MSENTQLPITPNIVTPQHRKSRHKHEKLRLPTPPPDPTLSEERTNKPPQTEKEKENEFFSYLDSLQKASTHPSLARSASIFSPAIAAEDAFDHLERLYKLMDQMLSLREQNARLHRRIRDLEHFSNIQKLQKQLETSGAEEDLTQWEKDVAFAETIFENIFNGSRREVKFKQAVPSKFRNSILRRQRNRSSSITVDSKSLDADKSLSSCKDTRRASEIPSDDKIKTSKVSKWTKVKAAFKWEKASPNVGDSKLHDSGIGGMLPVNVEVARYLRVPSSSEEPGVSPSDSGAAGISTPGSLSNTSSAEDLGRREFKNQWDNYQSSDDDQYLNNEYIPHGKDDKLPGKSCRTPWAKMRDIIQTRNSFKKSHRLSARSDDTRPDENIICSENEDVFEDDSSSNILQVSPTPVGEFPTKILIQQNEIPADVVERYQRIIAEDETGDKSNVGLRKVSRWLRVKKAFLTSPEEENIPELVPTRSESAKKVQEEINRNYKELQKKLSLEFQNKLQEWEKNKAAASGMTSPPTTSGLLMTEEHQDPAFLKKMEEWQKIKSQPSVKQKPPLQLQSEEHLPPEFRKKLQEWQKMKKSSYKERECHSKKKPVDSPKTKSSTSSKSDEVHFDYPPLSEEFLKKLEEWKQIKAAGGMQYNDDTESRKSNKDNKTPSPRIIRKSSPLKYKKNRDVQEKELQWFEKELTKIEKEKQRLERERQKFLEREERLTKLRRSIMGGNKKEVLVHTRSGFHRFEGISRKFTQKLYEWEKAQGIAPEESTFALLTSCYAPEIRPSISKGTNSTPPLVRSKSADSIATSALNLQCPHMTHQPSSLSLNDVDELEKQCLTESKASSMQYIDNFDDNLEDEEPEALIVEVEDIVEETAAPLENILEKQQTPVYQHEGYKSMCAGEACLAPKIRRSESARAQTNYNLIEDSLTLIKQMTDNEEEIRNLEEIAVPTPTDKLKKCYEAQRANAARLSDKLTRLQEANTIVTSNITNEGYGHSTHHLTEVIDAAQDLSSELPQLADKLDGEIAERNDYTPNAQKESTSAVDLLNQMNTKILELRRLLSYLCAASDLTAPGKKKLFNKKILSRRQNVCDSKGNKDGEPLRKHFTDEGIKYIKSENISSPSPNQGAVRKKIRHRQKSLQSKLQEESDDDEESNLSKTGEKKSSKHKKLMRTKSVTDTSGSSFSKSIQNDSENSDYENILVDPDVVQKVVVPTETNFVALDDAQKPPDSPVTIFVKTTRKLFTPFIEKSSSEKHLQNNHKNNVDNDSKHSETSQMLSKVELKSCSSNEGATADKEKIESTITTEKVQTDESTASPRLPPLPVSPNPQRKFSKEISPNIRIMLQKYNQKLSEQDITGPKSGGSSGSNSPVAWRSPTAERRVKAQTQRYQEEVQKLSPLFTSRREVQKSASVGILHSQKTQACTSSANSSNIKMADSDENTKHITKSSSIEFIPSKETKLSAEKPNNELTEKKTPPLRLSIRDRTVMSFFSSRSPDIRSRKLQKAKEEFLKSGCASAPVTSQGRDDVLKFPARNRLSQISVGSESSCDSSACEGLLVKSASAGMINIDADTYRKIDPEVHREGYVSLPRNCKKHKEGLLTNIASKFRKMRMRRGRERDPNKMNTVSTLCRQSLVVDINKRPCEEATSAIKRESKENFTIYE